MRSVSFVSGGMMPSRFWFARICSRAASQPMSNLPRYFSRYSRGAWCGECIEPEAHSIMNGRSGLIDLWPVIHWIARSARSWSRWYVLRYGSGVWSFHMTGTNWCTSAAMNV